MRLLAVAALCTACSAGSVNSSHQCPSTCGANAACDAESTGCACNNGFQGDPIAGCTPIPCFGVVCGLNATCDAGSSSCACNDGFEGDPVAGCTAIPCFGVTCGANASCDAATSTCKCAATFEGDPVAGCAATVAAATRRLGIEVNRPNDYDNAIALSESAGARVVPLPLSWAMIEAGPPDGGGQPVYDWTLLDSGLAYYHTAGLEVFLELDPITMNLDTRPSDLVGLALDATSVRDRYLAFLHEALTHHVTSDVIYLLLGNEIDLYFAAKFPTPADGWTAYQALLTAALTEVHTDKPGLPAGVSYRFGTIQNAAYGTVIGWESYSADFLAATYYFGSSDSGLTTYDVATDIGRMREVAGAKPLLLKEFGYATALSGNSEAGQIQFVTDLFVAWDAHPDIPYVCLSRLYDDNTSACQSTAQSLGYVEGTQAFDDFVAFLCSLGVHHFDGTAKPAWPRLLDASGARGF